MSSLTINIIRSAALAGLLVFVGTSCSITNRGSHAETQEFDTLAATSLMIEAKKQLLLGNHQDAAEKYRRLIDINPRDAVPHYELARLHRLYERYEQGLAHIREAIRLEPENKWYRLFGAELEIELGLFGDATRSYEKAMGLDPDNPELLLMYADALSRDKRYDDALDVYNELESHFGIDEGISYEKYRLHLMNKNVRGAVGELQKLIAAYPKEVSYLGALADLYLENGQAGEARGIYERMLRVDPDNPYIYLSLAGYYDRTFQQDSMSYALMKAFRSPSLDIDNKMQVLLGLYEGGEPRANEAYELIDTLVAIHPDEPKAWSIRGDFLVRDGRNEEARDAFRKVTQLDSLRYPVWEQLLLLESRLEDYSALVQEGKRVIRIFPEQPLPYLLTGAGHTQMKAYPDAISTLEHGLYYVANERLEAQFYAYLGEAHYQSGNTGLCFRAYDRLLELDSNNTVVLNNYAYRLALEGERLDEAVLMSDRSLLHEPGNPTYLDTRAWVSFRKKDYAEALEWIEVAMEKGGNANANVLEHYGDILFHLGRTDDAALWWLRAKNLGNDSGVLEEKLKKGIYVE